MSRHEVCAIFMGLGLTYSALAAPTSLIEYEDFDGPNLPAAWTPMATATVQYDVAGALRVFGLTANTEARFVHPIPESGDFLVEAVISWIAPADEAHYGFELQLRDQDGELIAMVGIRDEVGDNSGTRVANIEGSAWSSGGWGELPPSANATIQIKREGASITIKWEDAILWTGSSTRALAQIHLYTDYPWIPDAVFPQLRLHHLLVIGDGLTSCDADVTGDRVVDIDDLNQILAQFGEACE